MKTQLTKMNALVMAGMLTVGQSIFAGNAFAADAVVSTAAANAGSFELKGNIQTQASKAFYDNEKDDVLDGFWFRANVGGKYKSEDFDGEINIRMYAPKFGKVEGQDRFQADTYYGNYKWNAGDAGKFNVKLGHWKIDYSRGGNFGTYLELSLANRGFLNRDMAHDAFEAGWAMGDNYLTARISTGDNKFNTGYIAVEDQVKLAPLELNLGYRVNALDNMEKTAVMTNRIDLRANYEVMPKVNVYGEVAAIITGEDDKVNDASIAAGTAMKPEYAQGTTYVPFYIGVEAPVGKILDKVYAEFEYVNDREEISGKGADNGAWAVGLVKKAGDHAKLQLSLYSEKELSDVAVSARLTTTFK